MDNIKPESRNCYYCKIPVIGQVWHIFTGANCTQPICSKCDEEIHSKEGEKGKSKEGDE